jgi:DNA-directed RNA polymerase specialized sigma24 family protein
VRRGQQATGRTLPDSRAGGPHPRARRHMRRGAGPEIIRARWEIFRRSQQGEVGCGQAFNPARGPRDTWGRSSLANIPDLSDDRWDELLERLTYHASCKLSRLKWRGVTNGPAPAGIQPEDLAARAIELFLLGKRKWDRTAQPDLEKFLIGVVDSRISSLVRSLENRKSRRISPPGAGDESAAVHDFADWGMDPAKLVVRREEQEAFRAAALKALEGDEHAFEVFECFEADITKPADIAEYLGVPVEEIYNVQKRLRRKLDILRPKIRGGGRG